MDNLNLAKKCILFKELEKMDFQALLRCLYVRIKTYKAQEIIEYEGSSAKNAYVILSGHARSAYFDEVGNALPGIDFFKDSIFGLEYINIKNPVYKEEFYAVEETTVMICNLFKLLTPCENRCPRHHHVINKCILEYARLLTKEKERITELGKSKTRDKVLVYLKNNIKKTNVFVRIPYNRQELADYLGVERSALSYELSKLKKEGLIDYNKSLFMLLD